MSKLPYVLLVSTPTDKPIRTSQVCMQLPFRIDDRIFVADLLCLPLSGLDFILGMDWLFVNHVPHTLISKPITSMCFYLNSLVLDHCETGN